jgi:hypothetical protein
VALRAIRDGGRSVHDAVPLWVRAADSRGSAALSQVAATGVVPIHDLGKVVRLQQ